VSSLPGGIGLAWQPVVLFFTPATNVALSVFFRSAEQRPIVRVPTDFRALDVEMMPGLFIH
ncbi:hypothetical protein, partial [Escherichia coli]|uniref:hypothetical protein n=1 Tax=Escherichia coli TaxID=562 RepID=UPI001BDD7A44